MVEEVLVVDGVELEPLHQLAQVGRLDNGDAARLEDAGDAGHEAVEIGYVGDDVVGMDHVGRPATAGQLVGQVAGEELGQGGHAAGCRHFGDVPGRVDAQDRHAGPGVVLQQVAVVAGQLDDQAAGAKPSFGDQPFGDDARVLHERVRDRGEVRVVPEEDIGWDRLGDLDEPALGAVGQRERVARLRAVEVAFLEDGIGERHLSQIQNDPEPGRSAATARGLAHRAVVRYERYQPMVSSRPDSTVALGRQPSRRRARAAETRCSGISLRGRFRTTGSSWEPISFRIRRAMSMTGSRTPAAKLKAVPASSGRSPTASASIRIPAAASRT